jgi:hypothetical protein
MEKYKNHIRRKADVVFVQRKYCSQSTVSGQPEVSKASRMQRQ